MLFEEPSTPAGVYEVELGDGVLPGDRSPSVLFHLFREFPESWKAKDLSHDERKARSAYINLGHRQLAAELFGPPDRQRWASRQQLQIASLSDKEAGRYLLYLNAQMTTICRRLYDTPPSQRSREQYGGAYARYIRTRQLLGPAKMQKLIWDKVDELPQWRWFSAWRNQQRKLRSQKRADWLAEVHPNLPSQKAATARWNASESAKAAKKAYAQSEKGKAARRDRDARRAEKDAALLATPDDEIIRPEMLQ